MPVSGEPAVTLPVTAPADRLRCDLPAIRSILLLAGLATGCTSGDTTDASRLPHARFELVTSQVPAEAEATLRQALQGWSELISSPVPIRVQASFVDDGPAGFSVPGMIRDFPGAPMAGTWYAPALADALAGFDLQPDQPDMELFFRRNREWKFRLEGNPAPGEADFLTVAMHEIAHGLGMLTWVQLRDGIGSYGGDVTELLARFPVELRLPRLDHRPSAYTVFLADPDGRRLADTTWLENPSEAMGRFLTTVDLHFTGAAATRANGGVPPRVVGPSPSHLHPDDYFWTGDDYLMTTKSGTGVATPDPGPVLLGILQDIGWTLRRNP